MIQTVLAQAVAAARPAAELGQTASYIPELSKVDKHQLGACVFTADGGRFSAGDTKVRFSIQSISKVISLAAALELCGFETVFAQVGMEPSGDAFNAMGKLEAAGSSPSNPMINAGAIAVDSYLEPKISFDKMLAFTRKLCMDPEIVLDEKVYHSEMSNISRNRAIAYLLENKGVIRSDVERTLDFYVRMCSLSVTAESLAGLGLLLAGRRHLPCHRRAPALPRHRPGSQDHHAHLRNVRRLGHLCRPGGHPLQERRWRRHPVGGGPADGHRHLRSCPGRQGQQRGRRACAAPSVPAAASAHL